MGTNSRSFSLSSFQQFSSRLTLRGTYNASTIDFQNGFAANDLVDLQADPHLGTKGVSRFNSGAAGIAPTLELIYDDTTNGGGDPPDMTTFLQINTRLQFEGFSIIVAGTPVSNGNLWAAGTIASQASSCPNLTIAGFEGAVVVDACDGTVVKDYPGNAGASYFEALVLPTPTGETGSPALFMGGIGTFLANMGPTGDLGVPVIGPGFIFDSQAIAGDPVNGVVFTDFAVGDISFVTYDAANDVWEINPFSIELADVTDGILTYGARSAAMNAAGDELLVVGQAITDPFPFALLHLTLDAPVNLATQQAVQTVINLGALGSDPWRIRCDYTANVCGVADFGDSTVTVVDWNGAVAIVDTGNVGDGPVGIGVLGNHIISAGFNDDTYTVLTLDTDNTVMGPPVTVPLPNGCENPGHAGFLDDANNSAIVTCNGDGGTGGFVYVPNAF